MLYCEMNKISLTLQPADIAGLVNDAVPPTEILELMQKFAGEEFPGLPIAMNGEVPAGLRPGDLPAFLDLLYNKISGQIDQAQTIIWCPVSQEGLEYHIGYAPGNLRYYVSEFLIHHTHAADYIALRSELQDDNGSGQRPERFTNCLSAAIKTAVALGPPPAASSAARQAHKIKRRCPYKDVIEEFEITEVESLQRGLTESQFDILARTPHRTLAAAQAACAHDWANWTAPDKIVWYNSAGFGFDYLSGHLTPDSTFSYAVDKQRGGGMENYSVRARWLQAGEYSEKTLKENLSVVAAMEFCEQEARQHHCPARGANLTPTR